MSGPPIGVLQGVGEGMAPHGVLWLPSQGPHFLPGACFSYFSCIGQSTAKACLATTSMTKAVLSPRSALPRSALPRPPNGVRGGTRVPRPAHQTSALFSWALPLKTGARQKRSGLLDMFSFPFDFGTNRFLLLQSIFNKHYGQREIPGCSP